MNIEPMKYHIVTDPFMGEARLDIEGIEEKARDGGKKGIRFHNTITAFFLRLFGENKIVDVKDITGRTYHLNRDSLGDWIRLNGKGIDGRFHETTDFSAVTETAMRDFLRLVVRKKTAGSPVAEKNAKIAELEKEIYSIRENIRRRDEANRPNNWSIGERELEQKLAEKLEELNRVQNQ